MRDTIDDFLREDTFDSRDVIKRIDDLESDEDDLDEFDREELSDLRAFAEEASGYSSDWPYGESLIADSHFEEYAHSFAQEIGRITGDEEWPLDCINWKEAASELQMDYTMVTLRNVDFWIRS